MTNSTSKTRPSTIQESNDANAIHLGTLGYEQLPIKEVVSNHRFDALFSDEASKDVFLKSWNHAPNFLNRVLPKAA